MNVLILNIATNSVDINCEVVGLSYILVNMNGDNISILDSYSGKYKPSKLLSYTNMAVHHITNKMLDNKKSFKDDTDLHMKLKSFMKSFPVICHNSNFNLSVLSNYFDIPSDIKVVDTMTNERYLDDEFTRSHKLNHLRYYYGVERAQRVWLGST